MRKALVWILWGAVLLTAGGCGQSEQVSEESVPEEPSLEAPSRVEESSEEIRLGEKLQNSFEKLWDSTSYEMEVTMLVESHEDRTSRTDDSGTEADGTMRYHYQVAVDQNSDRAMLLMEMPDGTTGHLLIDNRVCYKLDDAAKTYEQQTYPYNAYSFGQLYTTELFLGMTDFLQLCDSGSREVELTELKKQTLDFESYRFTPGEEVSEALQDMTVTYYFRSDIPVCEVVETEQGKTTFLFDYISDKVEDVSVFEIPADYSEVKTQVSEN